jgi:hypothetical protein
VVVNCSVLGANGSPCGRPTTEDGKCLFHSSSKKDAKGFEKAFLTFISNENRNSGKVIDCTGFVFQDFAPEGKWHVGKSILFDNAIFSGNTELNLMFTKDVSFDHSRFLDNVDFTRSEFLDIAIFSGAEFNGSVRFNNVKFKHIVDFSDASFGKMAWFDHVEFSGDTIFRKTTFKENANFFMSKFRDEAFFPRSVFSQNCHFFKAEFLQDADFSNVEFMGKASFTDAVFTQLAKFSMTKFSGKTDFSGCRFKSETAYDNAAFLNTAGFQHAEFNGDTVFSEAEFSDIAILQDARFLGDTFFGQVQFLKEVDFDNAVFDKLADFFGARFLGNSGFRLCQFGGRVGFADAKFALAADFGQSHFLASADFEGSVFLGLTHFSNVRFAETAVFKRTKIGQYLSFERAVFAGDGYFQDLDFLESENQAGAALNFGSVVIRSADSVRFEGRGEKPLDLSRTRFAFTDTNMIRFLNVTFSNSKTVEGLGWRNRFVLWLANKSLNEHVRIYDEENVLEECAQKRIDDPRTMKFRTLKWEHVGAIYKGLRESYERSLKYDEAGQFHIREMEARRYAAGQKGSSRFGKWNRRNLSILNVYRWLSLYGESYRLTAIWIASTVFFFAVLRWLLNASLDDDIVSILSSLVDSLGENLSRSVLAFLQLKSDTTIDLLERIAGGILVILFGMALHRNFKR